MNSTGGGLAGRYAAALYAQASELDALDATVAELESLGALIDASADMRRLLDSPLVNVLTAQKAAAAVLEAQGFSTLVRNFVGVVVQNRRMRALRDIVAAFATLVAEKRGVVVAQVDILVVVAMEVIIVAVRGHRATVQEAAVVAGQLR